MYSAGIPNLSVEDLNYWVMYSGLANWVSYRTKKPAGRPRQTWLHYAKKHTFEHISGGYDYTETETVAQDSQLYNPTFTRTLWYSSNCAADSVGYANAACIWPMSVRGTAGKNWSEWVFRWSSVAEGGTLWETASTGVESLSLHDTLLPKANHEQRGPGTGAVTRTMCGKVEQTRIKRQKDTSFGRFMRQRRWMNQCWPVAASSSFSFRRTRECWLSYQASNNIPNACTRFQFKCRTSKAWGSYCTTSSMAPRKT